MFVLAMKEMMRVHVSHRCNGVGTHNKRFKLTPGGAVYPSVSRTQNVNNFRHSCRDSKNTGHLR